MTQDHLDYHAAARMVRAFNLRHNTDCYAYRAEKFIPCFETSHNILEGQWAMQGDHGSVCMICVRRFAFPDLTYTFTIEREGQEIVTVCTGTLTQLQAIIESLDYAHKFWESEDHPDGHHPLPYTMMESASMVATPTDGGPPCQYTGEWEAA